MRINDVTTTRTANTTRKRNVASSVNFAALLDMGGAEAAANAGTSEVAPTAPVNTLFALQEVGEEQASNKQLTKDADFALNRLEDLRHAILAGRVPVPMLRELARNIEMRKNTTTDPELLSIIEDIELRVAVELAKLEQSFKEEPNEL